MVLLVDELAQVLLGEVAFDVLGHFAERGLVFVELVPDALEVLLHGQQPSAVAFVVEVGGSCGVDEIGGGVLLHVGDDRTRGMC